jgi:hypothetical protein
VKITDAKVLVCCPGRNFLTLNIFTDEGAYGLGGATLNGRELPVGSYLTDHVIPCLIRRDPFQTEDLLQYLYRGAYWRGGPVTISQSARSTWRSGTSRVKLLTRRHTTCLKVREEPGCWEVSLPAGVPAHEPETGRNHFQLVIAVRERDSFVNNHGI